MSDIDETYNSLTKSLIELKEEYKILPSKFLLKKIELVESKLKQIEKLYLK